MDMSQNKANLKSGEFHRDLSNYAKQNKTSEANSLIMSELAKALVHDRENFVDLLAYSGIKADQSMSDVDLINKFIDNIHNNRQLLIGSAFLVNKRNAVIGFDGTSEISDNGVKTSALILSSYFDTNHFPDQTPDLSDDFYNAGGPGVASAISEGLKAASPIATKAMEGQQKKKYGALDLASKKQDARQQIISSVILQKQAQIEAKRKAEEQKAKTIRTTVIVVGSVVIVAATIMLIRRFNKNSSK